MYFPYLRGRQNELIALRELTDKSLLSDKIIPIIEPVKLSSTLLKTVQAFIDKDINLCIIRNPQIGSFLHEYSDDKNFELKARIQQQVASKAVISTYYITDRFPDKLQKIIDAGKNISDIIVICMNADYIPVYESVFALGKPQYSIIPDDSSFRRRIRHNRVMINNRFNKLERNTDYADSPDEFFSDDHKYYQDDGYVGYSDYSVIGDEYSESGFAPYAVAIHIVYFAEDKSLKIRHFVSDSNDDISDPARKFEEAVGKMVAWNKVKCIDTYGILKLTEMYYNQVYPGLGILKKLSLMHHLELIGRYLDGKI